MMTALEHKVLTTIAELSGPSLDGPDELAAIRQALNISEQDLDAAISALKKRRLINVGLQSYVRLNGNGRRIVHKSAQ